MAKCAKCRRNEGQRDGLCRACRLRVRGLAERKYHFTDELTRELRSAYALPRRARAQAVRQMMERTGWPHFVFRNEASRTGLAEYRREASVRMRLKPLEKWTVIDVHKIFLVECTAIRSWFRRGLFGPVERGRVSAEGVVRFIRKYPHEYDLRRVDQVLFKALVFGRMAEVE